MGLIFSLFNITLPQDVLFRQLLLLQCLHHGSESYIIAAAIKVKKQGQLSTSADILVYIFNPYNSANGLNKGLNCPLEYLQM